MSDMEIKTDVSTQPAIVTDKETSSSEKHISEPEFSDTVSCDKSGWCGCNVSAVEVDVVDSSSSTGCRVPDPCVVSGNMLDLVKDSSLTECTVINHIISSDELGKRAAVGDSTVNVCGRSTGACGSSSVEPKTLHSVAIVTEEIAIHRDTVQIQNVDGNKSSRTPSPTVVISMTRSQNGRCIEQEEARAVSPSVAPPALHNDECGLDSAGKKSPSDMAGSVSNGGPQTDSRPPCENSTEGSRSVELESGTSGSGFTSECLSRESPLQGPSLHHDPRPAADTGSNREAENEWEDKASDLGLSCHSTAGLRSLPCSVSYDSTPVSPGQAEVCGDEAFLEEGQRFMEVSLSSRNTYEASRRQSAPGHLPPGGGLDAADPSDLELQSKMPGIAEYLGRSLFSRRLQDRDLKGVNPSSPGWKLFGKVPPKQSPTKDSRTIQQQEASPCDLTSVSPPDLLTSREYVAKLGRTTAENSPTQNAQGRSRKNLEFEPLSTTALILEDRPANLPAKSVEEAQRHRQEYQEMVAEARKRELKEAQKRQKQMKERFKQEESIANAMVIWNNDILPHWDSMKSSRRARELWWHGLPPNVRGKVWSLAIGNELNITPGLYGIFLSRAKEKWRLFSETGSENEAEDGSSADRESSLELIKLDISRTFPSLFIFQKGGPYHDLLHSVLGAYTCYRPDVGYVQGMSFIAAVLILNLEEADAFIAFANLLNKPCQLAFFRVDHELMLKYFAAFEVFFEENLPRLFIHFQSSSLTPDLYLIDWIFTLYSKSLPLDVACRVWDVFCRDGEEFLFRTGLGILRLYEDVLLQMDFIHVCQFLTRPPNDELLSDRLFACIAATPMLAGGNRKWSQVFSSLVKDNKEMEKTSS